MLNTSPSVSSGECTVYTDCDCAWLYEVYCIQVVPNPQLAKRSDRTSRNSSPIMAYDVLLMTLFQLHLLLCYPVEEGWSGTTVRDCVNAECIVECLNECGSSQLAALPFGTLILLYPTLVDGRKKLSNDQNIQPELIGNRRWQYKCKDQKPWKRHVSKVPT